MKTVSISGKDYITVNERLKEFRKLHPDYSLLSDLVNVTPEHALIKARIVNTDGKVLAEGTAYEAAGSSFINKTSHVENCETSAWGRALGNLGIGIDTSVATADEIANAVMNQAKPAKIITKKKPTKAQAMEVLNNCITVKAVDVVLASLTKYDLGSDRADIEECAKNVKARINEADVKHAEGLAKSS